MPDLIERAAKAAHDADPWLYGQDEDGNDLYKPWEQTPPAVKAHYYAQAKAVLDVAAKSESRGST